MSTKCQNRICKRAAGSLWSKAKLQRNPAARFGAAGNMDFHSRRGDVPDVVNPIAGNVTRFGVLRPSVERLAFIGRFTAIILVEGVERHALTIGEHLTFSAVTGFGRCRLGKHNRSGQQGRAKSYRTNFYHEILLTTRDARRETPTAIRASI